MDAVAFLEALCWGNTQAITDHITRSARTSLTHSDRLVRVVSRWLHPPRTSQGGTKAGGARRTLMPLIIDTVKEVITEEMDAVVEELREETAEVTEQSVLGTVIDEVQGKFQYTAPVFCDLVRTAAWSEKQEERNKLEDPMTTSRYFECWIVMTSHLSESLAYFVYHLPGSIHAESPCKQDAPPHLTLPESLRHRSKSLRYDERTWRHIEPGVGARCCGEGCKE
jgi:hypothetical protein